jgi:hypothetical protein
MKRAKRRFRFKTVVVDGKTFRVQGYEPFFLNELAAYGLTVADVVVPAPAITYRLGKRWHRYYPDFYIPKTKTMVEIKSPYTMSKNKRKNLAKWSWARVAGYTMLVIVYDAKGRRV